MNIGFFADSFLPICDGVGRGLMSYAETLARKGHNVTVFAPESETADHEELPFRVVGSPKVPLPGSSYSLALPKLGRSFMREMRSTPLDIVHIHSPFFMGRLGEAEAHRRRIPCIATFHTNFREDFRQAAKLKVLNPLVNVAVKYVEKSFERCDEVWCVSRTACRFLREMGYTSDVQIMNNGIKLREKDETLCADIRRECGADERPVLMYAGQLDWKKNILNIIKAAQLVKQHGKEFTFIFAGDGIHRKEIEEAAERMGLKDTVKFVGHISESSLLDAYYAAADLLVFPSTYDTAGLVVPEAANMGTPSLVAALSGPSENIWSGMNGIICESDYISIAEGIEDAISDRAALAEMGRCARESIAVSDEQRIDEAFARYQYVINKGDVKQSLRGLRKYRLRW